jgi:hypothetical protein
MDVNPCNQTYKAIWESLKRLTKTGIDLEIWDGKGKDRKTNIEMTATMLTGAIHTANFQITVNPYFLEMYAEGLLTNLDLKFRASLSGSISKALYRFYAGQSGARYQCHALTLARAVNLNLDLSTSELRKRIRSGLRELRKKGYLQRWSLTKEDVVSVWKSKLPSVKQ